MELGWGYLSVFSVGRFLGGRLSSDRVRSFFFFFGVGLFSCSVGVDFGFWGYSYGFIFFSGFFIWFLGFWGFFKVFGRVGLGSFCFWRRVFRFFLFGGW